MNLASQMLLASLLQALEGAQGPALATALASLPGVVFPKAASLVWDSTFSPSWLS
jgi:hypothetical protein